MQISVIYTIYDYYLCTNNNGATTLILDPDWALPLVHNMQPHQTTLRHEELY